MEHQKKNQNHILIILTKHIVTQVALKRQQAAEDRIALHLAAAAGALQQPTALPPGRIYGMTVTPPTQHDKPQVY